MQKPKNNVNDDELQLIETPAPTPKPTLPPEREKVLEEEEAELMAYNTGLVY